MTSMAEVHGYRGIEYGVRDAGKGVWQWAYYPKIGESILQRGQVEGTRETAVAACKAAIDDLLGPKNSN